MKFRLLALLTIVCSVVNLRAQQVYPVDLSGVLIPPHSLNLSVYGNERPQDLSFTAMLNDPIEPFRDVRLNVYIEQNGKTIYRTDPNFAFPTLRLLMGQPVILDGTTLQPYLQPAALEGAGGQGMGSVILPEGLNRICVEVIDLQRNVPISRKACVTGGFFLNEPPLLQTPACGSFLPKAFFQNHLFNWTPLHIGSGNAPGPVEYKFKLVKLLPGADPNDGFDFSLNVLERTTTSPSLLYGPTDPPLEEGQTYAWRVEVKSMLSAGLFFRNEGKSQVCTFIFGNENSLGANAETAEEQRVAPQDCETFNTDFGPVSSQNYDPVPLAAGDKVKVGYFEMTVSEATPAGDGYSGKGSIVIPMLKSKVQVLFTGLKAKPNTLRCYEVQDLRAVGEQAFEIHSGLINQANAGNYITTDYVQKLKDFFSNGQGKFNKVSLFNAADPASKTLPIGLDKTDAPLIAVTGIRFTPRNCFLTCVGYNVLPNGQILRYAGLDIPITPYGVKSNSFLTAIDANTQQLFAQIFTLSSGGSGNNSTFSMDCLGFGAYISQPEFSVDPGVITKADGGGLVKFQLAESGSELGSYLGKVKRFDNFKIPGMPGFEFSMNEGAFDLRQNGKLPHDKLAAIYKAPGNEPWQGLYLHDAALILPEAYDFTNGNHKITLNNGAVTIAADGVYGQFSRYKLVTLDKGKVGNWRYSVDTMSLNVVKGFSQNARLAGQIQVPILDAPFRYSGVLQIGEAHSQFTVKPETGLRSMRLWRAQIDLSGASSVRAVMRDFQEDGKKFMPDADLSGLFSMNFSAEEFDNALVGDKGVIKPRLRQIFDFDKGAPSFELKNLKIEHLLVDPFQLPAKRYRITGYIPAEDGLKIAGKNTKLVELRLRYQEAVGNKPEELILDVFVKKGTDLLQFSFIAKANAKTGGFDFDRIEVKTDNVECQCIAYEAPARISPDGMGNMLEKVYEQFYAPALPALHFQSGSLAAEKSFGGEDYALFLASYKAATLEKLRQHLVGGFPLVDGALSISFLNLQLDFQQIGANYAAVKTIDRSSPDFDFEHIDNLPQAGLRSLPLDLTPELRSKMGMSNAALPANSKLLITDFKVNGASAPTLANTSVEFTLLCKIGDQYVQFVRKDVKVSPETVEMRDFYMWLEQDVFLHSPVFGDSTIVFKKSAKKTGIGSVETDSYAFLLCSGFQGFNVQGAYRLPFDGSATFPEGQLKMRNLKESDPKTAESQLQLAFRVSQSSELGQFIAGVKNTTADGKALSFVLEGQEGVLFKAGDKGEIYLDYDLNKNHTNMPDEAGNDFRGLYFHKIQAEIAGFLMEDGKSNLSVDLEKFYFNPLSGFGYNGMGGAANFYNLQLYSKGAKLGGWQYGIDTLSIDFTNAWKRKDQPYYISGQLRCPLFNDNGGKDLLRFAGTFGFDKDKDKDDKITYQPGGTFTVFSKIAGQDAVKTQDLMQGGKFKADWLPGLIFTLKKGCQVNFQWTVFEDGSKGFMPTAELNGTANIAIGKDKALTPAIAQGEKAGSNGGASGSAGGSLEFNLPEVSFEGLTINMPEDDKTGKIGGKSGIKTLGLGTWGLNVDGLFEKSNRPQPRMQAFPITISTPELSYRKSDQTWLMTIEIAINLLKEDTTVTEERVKEYKDVATSGVAGSTVLAFKFKPGEKEALVFAGVELKEIAVQGIFAAFEVEAIVRFLKDGNEREWGSGFIGKGIIKLTEGPEFRLETIVQYGTITREAPATGSFRYFFADLEGVYKTVQAPHFGQFLIKTPPPVGPIDVLNLHGIGGGFWYNMEKTSPVDYAAPEEKETPIGAELVNGRGINGFEYKPKERSYGGFVKGIFSILQPSMLTFDLSVGIEVGANNAGHMSLKKIFAQGIGYMMIESAIDRDAAPVTITAEVELDIANKRLSGAFKVDVKVVLPDEGNPNASKRGKAEVKTMTGVDPKDRIIGFRVDPAVSRGSFLIEFKSGGKFYIKAGTPSSPMEGKLDIFGLVAISVGAYVQMGTSLDSMPDVKDIVPGWPDQGARVASRNLEPTSGICFGMRLNIKQTFNMGIFYADLGGGFGFDVAMGKSNARCQGKPVGLNGWMLKGQVYAYVSANVGMEFKLGPKRGRVSVMKAFVGAMLRGQFPNPTLFSGQLVGRFSVLGGLVSGGFNLKFRLASKRDIDCLNEVLSNPNRVLASLPIVSTKYPDTEKSKDVPIFVNPKLVYNLNVGSELQIEDVDADGNDVVRLFRPILDPIEGFLLKKGNAVVPCTPVFESKSTTLKPLKMLEPKTAYSISWKLRWQQQIDGKWVNLPDSTSETGRIDFNTGPMPDVIVSEFLDYHAPGRNQRYWHQGYADTRLKFDKAGGSFNWQQQYFPQYKDVPNYGRVNYDYVVRLTRFNNAEEEKVMDIPLSEYPGLKNFQVPVTSYVQVGGKFIIPRVTVQNAQGLNVGFAAVDDSINSAPEWRNKLCRLEIIRLPILPKTATQENVTEQTAGKPEFSDGNDQQIRTTSLVSDESKLPLGDGLKILYRYWFATSKYANLNEKLTNSTLNAYASSVKRTDYNHPNDATELDFSFSHSDQDFPGFTDDYFGFNCPDEGFDAFDLDRIRLNAVVRHPDDFTLQQKLWTDANGAKRFHAFSDIAFTGQINFDYNFGSDFKINFVCNTGTEQIKSYKELLVSDKQLNLTTLKKYWNARMIDPEDNRDWTGKFLLPKSPKNTLSEGEITNKALNYTAYSGKEVNDGWQGDVITESKTFGMMYQDQRSRILGLQYMTMRASIDKAYSRAVKATVFDRTGEAAVPKIQKRFGHGDAWNDHFWNFTPNRAVTYSYDGETKSYTRTWVYTEPNSAKEDFSGVKKWYLDNKTQFAKEADLYYKGKVEISFPKLTKWQDMGQSVANNLSAYPQYRVTVYPNRPGVTKTTGTAEDNIAAETTGADAFHFARAGKNIYLNTRPADADVLSLEIQLSKLPNGSDYQRVAFWEAASREVDLYSNTGKRSIKYNALLPGKDSINLSDLFQVPAGAGNILTNWTKDSIYRNHNVRILLKTKQGAYTYEAGPSGTFLPLNNKNQTHSHQRQKALHLSRGVGPTANMVTLKMIGTEGDLGFGACMIVDTLTKKVVAHLDTDLKLRRYNYTDKGAKPIASDYTFGSPMVELDPTRNYVIYMAKAGDSQYSAALVLDKNAFWQDKVGQFFESGTFGKQQLGGAAPPEVVGYNGVSMSVPGKLEAEDYGQPNCPALSGEGFAYQDNDPENWYLNYRKKEGVDILLDAGRPYVTHVHAGEWLAYKINVPTAGKYILDIRAKATGNKREMSMELDGNQTWFSPIVLDQSNSFVIKRVETLELPAGEHILKLLFGDERIDLDYLDIKAFAPDVKVKSGGVEIIDNSTGFNLNNGTDFGNQPCPAPAKVFTISNNGAGTLKLTGNPVVAITGPNAADFKLVALPLQVLAEQASTTFSIEFLPDNSNYGERTATVSIKTNAPGSQSDFTFNIRASNNPVEIELRAEQQVLANSAKTPEPQAPNFFGGVLESTSNTRSFTLYNSGTIPMAVSQKITGDSVSEFIVTEFPTSVPAGGNASFKVTFSPRADKSGLRTANLNITSIDCDENPYVLALAGAKMATGLDLSDASSVQLPPDQYFNNDFTLEAWVAYRAYSYHAPLMEFSSGANTVRFSLSDEYESNRFNLEVVKTGNIQKVVSNKDLPKKRWTHLAVVFNGGKATLYMDGAACGTATVQTPDPVLFTKCVLGGGGAFAVDELRIWNKALGAAQIAGNMHCELNGNEPGLRLYYRFNQGIPNGDNQTVTTVPNSRTGATDQALLKGFKLIGGVSNWSQGAPTVKPGQNCAGQYPDLEVRTAAGVLIPGNAAAGADTDFGLLKAGENKTLGFSMFNIGAAALNFSGATPISISGPNASEFSVVPGFSAAPIAAKSAAPFSVKFTPVGIGGPRSASLLIENNSGSTYVLQLKGALDAPGFELSGNKSMIPNGNTLVSAANLTDFGPSSIGGPAIERSFSIKNTGTLPLSLGALQISGAAAGDFNINPPVSSNLSPGQSISFGVLFRPGAAGARNAVITIPTNMAGDFSKWQFAVAGTGARPANVLAFDGADDVIEVVPEHYFKGKFTVEAWVNVRKEQENARLFEFSDASGNNAVTFSLFGAKAGFYAPTPKPVFEIKVNGAKTVSSPRRPFLLNTWTHIAVVFNGKQSFIYVNGEWSGLDNMQAPAAVAFTKCLIGSGKANMLLDEFRIWSRDLDEDEIKARMYCELQGNEDKLALYYPFNQGIPGGANAAVSFVKQAKTGLANNGILRNFALNGSISNWITQINPVKEDACPPYARELFTVALDENSPYLIKNEADAYGFGRHPMLNDVTQILYISNRTDAPLEMSAPNTSGPAAGDFTAELPANKVILPGQSMQIPVVFRPSALGLREAVLSISAAGQSVPWRGKISGTGVETCQSLSFDGIDDYIQLPAGKYINGDFTIEAWFVPIYFVPGCSFMYFEDASKNNRFEIGFPALEIVKNGVKQRVTPGDFDRSFQWMHFALTMKGRQGRMYLNGNLYASFEADIPHAASWARCVIGNKTQIELDELRIWNTALSVQEINAHKDCALKGDEKDLAFYCDFNQGSPSTDNYDVNFIIDRKSQTKQGSLNNFALTDRGNIGNSNWKAKAPPISGVCKPYVPAAEITIQGDNPPSNIIRGTAAPAANSYTNFGNQGIGREALRNFDILNSGTDVLEITDISLSGAQAGDFSVQMPPQTSLAPDGKTTFSIRFKPGTEGAKNVQVLVRSNAGDYSFALAGKGIPDGAAMDITADYAWRDYYVGLDWSNKSTKQIATSSQGKKIGSGATLDVGEGRFNLNTGVSLRIYNPGSQSLNASDIRISGPNAEQFKFSSVSNYYQECSRFSVGSLEFNNYYIQFTPQGENGEKTAQLTIKSNDAGQPDYVIQLSGRKTNYTTEVDVKQVVANQSIPSGAQAGPLTDFGKLTVGEQKTLDYIIEYDSNRDPLKLTGTPKVLIGGPNKDAFSVTLEETRNGIFMHVVFKPLGESGARSASLEIPNNDPDESNYVVNLIGEAIGPLPKIAMRNRLPDGKDFTFAQNGLLDLGSFAYGRSVLNWFNIYNIGTGFLRLAETQSFEISGPDADRFEICYQPQNKLISKEDQNYSVAICTKANTPPGDWRAVLTIKSNDLTAGEFKVNLRARITPAPEINLRSGLGYDLVSGTELNFGNVAANAETKDLSFVIENKGDGLLSLSGTPLLKLSGANADQFEIVSAPTNTQIEGKNNIAFSLRFKPLREDTAKAQLTIVSDDLDEPEYTLNLKGAGIYGLAPGGGRSLDFDGMNDQLYLDFPSYDFDNATIECWIKPTSYQRRLLYGDYSDGNSNRGADVVLFIDNQGNISWYTNISTPGGDPVSQQNILTNAPVPLNTWTHLAIVRSKSGTVQTTKAYINGELQKTVNNASIQITTGSIRIGLRSVRESMNYKGLMDELRFWSQPLAASDISGRMRCELQGKEPGLVGYFNFNQGLAGGNNTGEKKLLNRKIGAKDNNMFISFGLTGDNSNFVADAAVTAGNTCVPPGPPPTPEIEVRDGNGVTVADKATANFGSVALGMPKNYTFFIGNTGTGKLNLTGAPTITLSGPDANQFSIESDLNTTNVSVGGSMLLNVKCLPSGALGTRRAVITIPNNDADEGSFKINLVAEAIAAPAPEIELRNGTAAIANGAPAGSATDFGSVVSGTAKEMVFSIANLGNGGLNLGNTDKITISGPNAAQFTMTAPLNAAMVAPGSTEVFSLRFSAEGSPGPRTAMLTIVSDDADESRYVLNLTASVVPVPSPEIDIRSGTNTIANNAAASTFTDFGAVNSGESKTITFNIVNTGNAPLLLNGNPKISLSGTHAEQFSITPAFDQSSINPGESADFSLQFNPSGPLGDRIATVNIANNDSNEGTFRFQVKGEALQQASTADALDFDGIDDYLELPRANYIQGDFTMEAWVWVKQFDAGARLIELGNGLNDNIHFCLSEGKSGKPMLGMIKNGQTKYAKSDEAIPINAWTHIAVTLRGATATIYINGQAQPSATVFVPNKVLRSQCFIGKNAFGSPVFSRARFDEIRIWNRALTADELNANRNCSLKGTEAGLAFYLNLNQGHADENNEAVIFADDKHPGGTSKCTLKGFSLNGDVSNWVKANGPAKKCD